MVHHVLDPVKKFVVTLDGPSVDGPHFTQTYELRPERKFSPKKTGKILWGSLDLAKSNNWLKKSTKFSKHLLTGWKPNRIVCANWWDALKLMNNWSNPLTKISFVALTTERARNGVVNEISTLPHSSGADGDARESSVQLWYTVYWVYQWFIIQQPDLKTK